MEKEDNLSPNERKQVKEEIKKVLHQKLLKDASALGNEYKKQVSTAIITAFGLVIALVWKDVVTALIPSITAPGFLEEYALLAQIYIAGIVTVFAITGILIISRWGRKEKE